MSLRTLLIIIGVLIVAAVYFFGVRKRKQDSRVTYDRRFARMEIPDVILDHDEPSALDGADDRDDAGGDNWQIVVKPSTPRIQPPSAAPAGRAPRGSTPVEPRLSLPPDVILPPQDRALEELPVVRNDAVVAPEPSNARRRTDQLDMFGAPETAAASPRSSRSASRSASGPAETLPPDDGLIMLYVRAREAQPIGGPALVRAFNAVGMQHGEMSIFHHFGAGELKCEKAVFSAANMFEPGTFDLARIEAFRTAGVALFLQLPCALDGPVAFELLLNTAQRLTEIVGAELYATPQARLDSKAIARLRGRAARFGHAAH